MISKNNIFIVAVLNLFNRITVVKMKPITYFKLIGAH